MNKFITLRRIAVAVVAEATLKIIISIYFLSFFMERKGEHKIKGDVKISDYSDGGLTMIDLTSFNKALKSIWIKKKYRQIQKTRVNGNSSLTLSYNSLVSQP